MTFDQRPLSLFGTAILLGTVLIFAHLGGSGIANYDDCFYAQKGKELLQGGSWLTLYYNGSPSFENPPFFIWLIAFSYTIFGVGDFGAIFPSALFGVLTIALVFFTARWLYDSWTGFASAFILSTTFFFVKYARHAMIDVTLSFFVTLALVALLLAVRRDRRFFLLWGGSVAVCILLKSVLGFFPALITVIYLVLTNRWRILIDGWFLAGSALVFTVGCSWYLHQYIEFGADFTNLHFSWLIVQRGFQAAPDPWTSHLSYLKDIFFYYWPWLPVLLVGLYRLAGREGRKNDTAVLLLSWVVLIPLIMSLMQTRSSWYIMPIYPAASIICATVFRGWLSSRVKRAAVRGAAITGIIAALAIYLIPLQLSPEREKDVRTLAPVVKLLNEQGTPVVGYHFDFHSVNNALLFYSDHAAEPVYTELDDLVRRSSIDPVPVCLLYTRHTGVVLEALPGSKVLMTTESLALVSLGSIPAD